MAPPRVVIVGGGFGGLACARALDGTDVDVVLLDAVNYHLFTPLLYQVATALLNPSDIAYPLRARFRRSRNVRFRQARVRQVDLDGKAVWTEDGESFPYDRVVIATGSANNYFGNPKLAEVALGLKTLPEAIRLRNHALACLERASTTSHPEERRRWLTFVTVGGGPTGVEYAGALGELLDLVLGGDFPELKRGESRIVLIEGQDRVLPAYAPSLGRYADRELRRRGVDVRAGALMEGVTDRGILITGGEEIQTETIVWSAGVRANDGVVGEAAPRSRTARIRVDDRLRIEGHPDAFAIGDVASVTGEGEELPMLSPPAMQEGRHVARLILRGSAPPFRYFDKGSLATIGRTSAVGQVGRFRFTGFIGWVVWLVVHIYYLIGFRNRLAVLLSWSWDYFRRDRPIRIMTQAQEDELVQG